MKLSSRMDPCLHSDVCTSAQSAHQLCGDAYGVITGHVGHYGVTTGVLLVSFWSGTPMLWWPLAKLCLWWCLICWEKILTSGSKIFMFYSWTLLRRTLLVRIISYCEFPLLHLAVCTLFLWGICFYSNLQSWWINNWLSRNNWASIPTHNKHWTVCLKDYHLLGISGKRQMAPNKLTVALSAVTSCPFGMTPYCPSQAFTLLAKQLKSFGVHA